MNSHEFEISKVHITTYLKSHPIKKYSYDFKDSKIFTDPEFQQLLLLGIMNEKIIYSNISNTYIKNIGICFNNLIGEFYASNHNTTSIQYKFEYIYKPYAIPQYEYKIEHIMKLNIIEPTPYNTNIYFKRIYFKKGFKISVYDRMNRCLYKYEGLFADVYKKIESLFSHSLDYIIKNIDEEGYDTYKPYSLYSKAVINLIEFVSNINFVIDDELYNSIYIQLRHNLWVARYKRYLYDDKFRWVYYGFLNSPVTRTLLYIKTTDKDLNNILKMHMYDNLIILDSRCHMQCKNK